jgi:membrane protease YdiL (CAAX protease family)
MSMVILEIIDSFLGPITLTHVICLAGIASFACWLIRTSLGREALTDSVPRRHNMPPYMPFVPLFVWLGPVALTTLLAREITYHLCGSQSHFLDSAILSAGALVTSAVIILLARASFARRLRGFGFNVSTIPKDLLTGIVNLLSVWPLMLAMILVTAYFGRLIWGQEYQIQQHEELKQITETSDVLLQILIFVQAVAIAPLLEETLFRGLFQTMVRSLLGGPWAAIAISSVLFVVVHQDAAHWPALYVLSLCFGYAYEKSGSLFRPIFIHGLFNGITVIAALSQ